MVLGVIIAAFTLIAAFSKREEVCAKGLGQEVKRMFYHGGTAHASYSHN